MVGVTDSMSELNALLNCGKNNHSSTVISEAHSETYSRKAVVSSTNNTGLLWGVIVEVVGSHSRRKAKAHSSRRRRNHHHRKCMKL